MTPRLSVWPPLPPRAWLARPRPALPFPLEEPGCRLFSRARHGLWHGVRAAGLEPGDEVLVPAYHHGSEVEALLRAGLRCRFYGALEPDEDELAGLVGERTRALYVVHYLGHPQDAARWRRWCDERRLLLVEDAAQAWLARDAAGAPVGSLGDVSITCLYKTYGVPDGAALHVRAPVRRADTAEAVGLLPALVRNARWLGERHEAVAAALARVRRAPAAYDRDADFALGEPSRPALPVSRFLLRRLADDADAARRRAHAQELVERLGELVPAPFARIADGASPFGVPVEVDDKERALAVLAERGVDALDFWSEPHPELREADHPEVRRRRERTLVLPAHQELPPDAPTRIAAALEQAA